jgi:hypothetical protein
VSIPSERLSLQITATLLFPYPPCSCRAPSGPPLSTGAASSVGRQRAKPPSPSPRHAASTVGPCCHLITRRPDSAPLVLTAPTEPPPGHQRIAGDLATVRATAAVTVRRHSHESRSLAFGPPSRPGRFNRPLAQRSQIFFYRFPIYLIPRK